MYVCCACVSGLKHQGQDKLIFVVCLFLLLVPAVLPPVIHPDIILPTVSYLSFLFRISLATRAFRQQ